MKDNDIQHQMHQNTVNDAEVNVGEDIDVTEVLNNTSSADDSEVNAQGDELQNDMKDFEAEILQLKTMVTELKDAYIRAQAEIQNTQRRSVEEVKKAHDFAISSFAKDIIVVKDYLEMALKDESSNFEAMKMGVDLTLKQLIQVFERHAVKEINPNIKDKLDPYLHQAMENVEIDGYEANSIVNVRQKGYSLNKRVLRPAMVTVAKDSKLNANEE